MYTDREVAIRYRMALEAAQAWNNHGNKSEILKGILVEALKFDIPKPSEVKIVGPGELVKIGTPQFPPGARAGQY